MKKIAITGNIGSGKTSCCQILEMLGYPVYFADIKAKWLMQHNPTLRQKITRFFGPRAYKGDRLNRAYLAKQVFSDSQALQGLNEIVHPAVHKDMQSWMQEREDEGYVAAFEEAALTFEAGHQKSFDYLITVAAPERLLIQRVMKRDDSSEEEVRNRLEKQLSQKEKCQQSDGIILNDGQHSLIFQIQNMIDRWKLSSLT